MSTKTEITATDVTVSAGDRFATRLGRRVIVDAVTWETGVPRVVARELEVACAHTLLRELNGGTCPTCRAPVPGVFEVALTFTKKLGAWCMPAGYVSESDRA